jgi:hypothetical protein
MWEGRRDVGAKRPSGTNKLWLQSLKPTTKKLRVNEGADREGVSEG